MKRLGDGDFTYWFMHRVFGWPVVMQIMWHFPRPVDESALKGLGELMARGPVNRRIVTSPIPFARPRWSHSPGAPDIVIDPDPIGPDEVVAWATDELDTVDLDPVSGRQWQLRATAISDGGYLVSLTTLHVICDGRAFIETVADALTGVAKDDPLPVAVSRSWRTLAADVRDAAAVIAAAARVLWKLVVGAVSRRDPTPASERVIDPRTPRIAIPERAPDARPAWAFVSVSATEVATVAAAHGGSATTLFIALIAGALRREGHLPLGEPIKVGIPVSQRTDGDDRANATAGVSVMLTDDPVPGGDLSGIRRLCKEAYVALAAGERGGLVHLQPLMHVVPTSLVLKVATAGSGMPDAVVSHVGLCPSGLREIGGVRATTMMSRNIAQDVDPAKAHRFGDGLQSWSMQVDDDVTLAVAAFDESAFADSPALRAALAAELREWGLTYRLW